MISEQELLKLRNLSSQKQSNLNGLLSEKQGLNNTISHYKSLNQTQSQQYIDSLSKLSLINSEILEYSASIKETENNIAFIEQKLSEIASFEDFMQDMDSILSEYSNIEGQKIDQSTMMVKTLPRNEIMHTDLPKEVCREQCLEAFKDLVTKLDDINAVDSEGRTLLMHALSHGFFPAVDVLLSDPDLDVNILDKAGQNALMYACCMPHIKHVKLIAYKTNNLNLKSLDTGSTALNLLVPRIEGTSIFIYKDEFLFFKENVEEARSIMEPMCKCCARSKIIQEKYSFITQLLINKGADLNIPNDKGLTPFMHACHYKMDLMAVAILDNAKEPINMELTDYYGYNSFNRALLLSYPDNYLAKKALKHIKDINWQDQEGKTALHWVCANNCTKSVKFLIDNGAKHNIADKAGLYPIHSINLSQILVNSSIIEELVENKVDINTKSLIKGRTLLQHLSINTTQDQFFSIIVITSVLKKLGASLFVQDNQGWSLMHDAFFTGNIDFIRFLKRNDLQINCLTNDKKTGLHLLLENTEIQLSAKTSIIKRYNHEYELSLKDKDGKTVVFDYAKEYCPDVVDLLFVNNTDVITNNNAAVISQINDIGISGNAYQYE